MAIFSLNHKYIGKLKHPPRLASAHLRYILRASACEEVIAANLPTPEIGTPGGLTKEWLELQEDKTRKNGRVIDKITLALPIELSQAQRVELIKLFVQDITNDQETFWLAALHDQKSRNPHAHMIFRDLGVFTGKRVIEFSERDSTRRLRERWAVVTNDYFAERNIDEQIDHRSLKVQREELLLKADWALDESERSSLLEAAEELNRKPAGHDGPEIRAMKEKGQHTEKLARLEAHREDLSRTEPKQTSKERKTLPPTIAKINKSMATLREAKKPPTLANKHRDQSGEWWDAIFADRTEQAGMIVMLAILNPKATFDELVEIQKGYEAHLEENENSHLRPHLTALAELGHAVGNGWWRVLPPIARAVANNPKIVQEIPFQSVSDNKPEQESTELDLQENDQNLATSASETTEDLRRTRQEARAEETAIKAETKAAKKARKGIERQIYDSRTRVLRGRKTKNATKGFFANLRTGREMRRPYPASKLKTATDAFLSAATWLTNSWDDFRNGLKQEPNFEIDEQRYIDASEELTEMHLVVPSFKNMDGDELSAEQDRLESLYAFPDQELVKPVMTRIGSRLSKLVAYFTNTRDGKTKFEEIAAKRRIEEAEQREAQDAEQRATAERDKLWEEKNIRSTAAIVLPILERSVTDVDVKDIVNSYGLDTNRTPDEIAFDPFWRYLAPGNRNVARFDLEERVKELDESRKRKSDQAKLKELATSIAMILDCAATYSEIENLIQHIPTHQWRDRQEILEDLRWLEPAHKYGQEAALWEVALIRIKQLDKFEEQRIERNQRSKMSKPNEPSGSKKEGPSS